ncbi:hypothetical protein PQQ96_37390 [Paraburkholderia sediminicola]
MQNQLELKIIGAMLPDVDFFIPRSVKRMWQAAFRGMNEVAFLTYLAVV